MQLVLGRIGRLRLLEDLTRDLLELTVRVRAAVPVDPRPVDRHNATLEQPGAVTQPQYLTEQLSQRVLMPTDEPRDRGVISNKVPHDHPIGHVLTTMPLNRPRRTHIRRKRIQDQRHHHRRLIGRATVTISPIVGIELLQLHLGDRVNHKPRQMIGRQPLPHIGRKQQPLLTTTLNEVLRHARRVINPPDRNPFVRQPRTRALG
jgi:hypothetical protein